jgi:hypothetical protein
MRRDYRMPDWSLRRFSQRYSRCGQVIGRVGTMFRQPSWYVIVVIGDTDLSQVFYH